ncbi:hypothetical protein ACSBR1_040184 [Camellia fascicularis]
MSFDSYNYAIVFISNIYTTIYLASVARIGKLSGLNSFGLMWCNGKMIGLRQNHIFRVLNLSIENEIYWPL